MIMVFLAEAMGLREILPWVTTLVVAVIGAVMAPMLKSRWKDEAKRETLVGPQPFEVRLKEEFVTRREFERLEATVAVNMTEVKGLFRETMQEVRAQSAALATKVEKQNKSLSDKIEAVAGGAYMGRQKIWVQTNASREDIAALKERVVVIDSIEKLADSLKPAATTKVQPTHQAHS